MVLSFDGSADECIVSVSKYYDDGCVEGSGKH
jgi:hypothetical protein